MEIFFSDISIIGLENIPKVSLLYLRKGLWYFVEITQINLSILA